MPAVDPHTEAIVHLTEAFAADGKSFATYMRTNPDAANDMIDELANAPDDADEPTDAELDAMPSPLPAGTLDLDNPEDGE